jgi:hypothetical protein
MEQQERSVEEVCRDVLRQEGFTEEQIAAWEKEIDDKVQLLEGMSTIVGGCRVYDP